jgi:HK97 family phage prohead protease
MREDMPSQHQTLLAIKAVEIGDGRYIEGWATTPHEDRVGDVVDPEGATYKLPLPLLFAHKHEEPIGSVVQASVTKAGIRIRAKLTAGVTRSDEVWRLLQDGALHAVSIGFQVLKYSPLPQGGQRFEKWEWHELSVVSVPANPNARISVAKCAAVTAPIPASEFPPAIDKRLVQPAGFNFELFGAAVGKLIRDTVNPLQQRIKKLEAHAGDLKSERRGLAFKGEFQRALPYSEGDLVTKGNRAYVAVKDIPAGEHLRDGKDGWVLIFKEGQE